MLILLIGTFSIKKTALPPTPSRLPLPELWGDFSGLRSIHISVWPIVVKGPFWSLSPSSSTQPMGGNGLGKPTALPMPPSHRWAGPSNTSVQDDFCLPLQTLSAASPTHLHQQPMLPFFQPGEVWEEIDWKEEGEVECSFPWLPLCWLP